MSRLRHLTLRSTAGITRCGDKRPLQRLDPHPPPFISTRCYRSANQKQRVRNLTGQFAEKNKKRGLRTEKKKKKKTSRRSRDNCAENTLEISAPASASSRHQLTHGVDEWKHRLQIFRKRQTSEACTENTPESSVEKEQRPHAEAARVWPTKTTTKPSAKCHGVRSSHVPLVAFPSAASDDARSPLCGRAAFHVLGLMSREYTNIGALIGQRAT